MPRLARKATCKQQQTHAHTTYVQAMHALQYLAVQTQYTGVAILTWQADVLNLQVLEGGRTGVAKETVRRHDATFRLALAPRQT